MTNKENFMECETVEEANKISLEEYVFIGLRDDKYCFKIRQRK